MSEDNSIEVFEQSVAVGELYRTLQSIHANKHSEDSSSEITKGARLRKRPFSVKSKLSLVDGAGLLICRVDIISGCTP
jgi:hypothetical protein